MAWKWYKEGMAWYGIVETSKFGSTQRKKESIKVVLGKGERALSHPVGEGADPGGNTAIH